MISRLIICLLLVGFHWTLAHAALPPSWMKNITVDLETDAEDVLIAVPLDEEVYRKTEIDFPSLLILDEEQREISYLITHESDTRTRTTEQRWSPETVSLTPRDQQLEVEVELPEDVPPLSKLELDTPLKNFEQRVRVYGMNGDEERLLADEVIFDYTQYMDVRRTSIKLPETNTRQFRLLIDDPTSEQESQLLQLTRQLQAGEETSRQERFTVERRPFRIDRVWFISRQEMQVPDRPLIVDWNIEISNMTEDQKNGQTLFELKTARQPLTRVTLKTSSQNFSRRVWIETFSSQPGEKEWERLSEGRFTKFQFGENDSRDLTIKFPERRAVNYRLVIENRDSDPLKIDDITGSGHRHQVMFLADEEHEYELHYGASSTSSPQYDTAAIELMLSEGVTPLQAELGPEIQLSEDAGEQPWTIERIIANPVFLGVTIAILTLLLGVSLYQASSKLNDAGQGNQDENTG